MWYGEYQHTLDNKDRFILPAKFREKIKKFKIKKFYITRGLEKCLFLFPEEVWQELEKKLKEIPFSQKDARFFSRLYFSGAQEIEIDEQGRIIIPTYLKEFAQIKKEIIIIGVSNRIEIWAREKWIEFYYANHKNFESVAENIFK